MHCRSFGIARGLVRSGLLSIVVLTIGAGANAEQVGFLSELHTSNDRFAIINISESSTIDKIKIQLGDDAVFDTDGTSSPYLWSNGSHNSLLAAVLGEISIPHEHDADPTSVYGADNPWLALTGTVTLTDVLSSAVVDGATQAILNFTGFDPGDAWGFFVGFRNSDDEEAVGPDMSNTSFEITFSNGTVVTQTFEDGPTANGKKGSFPSGAVVEAPEAAAVTLAGLALAALTAVAVRQRKRRVQTAGVSIA